jgi:flagellar basal-body rod protein FlgB
MPDRVLSTIDYLEAGLRGTALRQSCIARNIANLDTPGYRRCDAMFEKVLAEAIDDGKPASLDDAGSWVLAPGTSPVNENGNDVDLDAEVGAMVKNASRYKAYMRILNHMYKQLDMVIREDVK